MGGGSWGILDSLLLLVLFQDLRSLNTIEYFGFSLKHYSVLFQLSLFGLLFSSFGAILLREEKVVHVVA